VSTDLEGCNYCEGYAAHKPDCPYSSIVIPRPKTTTFVMPVDKWGRRPLFQAKVGTMSATLVLIKGARRAGQDFFMDERIAYFEWSELQGRAVGFGPHDWHNGVIWKIEDNRLFINKGSH
jgi:hypothetical protein